MVKPGVTVVSLRTVRWGGTLLPKAIGRAMEWPESCLKRNYRFVSVSQKRR